jgi:hypothetical protein
MRWPDLFSGKAQPEEPAKADETPVSTELPPATAVLPSDYCRVLTITPTVPPKTQEEPPAITPALLPHAPLRPDQKPPITPEIHKHADPAYPKVEGLGFVGGQGTYRKDN